MAINLNDSLYGAQFRAFQALADDTRLGQDTLVSVDESGRGKGLLNEAGCLPFNFEAARFAKEFKSVLDLTKHYRAKLPKAYGDLVADTILGTLKAGDRMFDADELKVIDAELCEEIAATAKKIDTGNLLSPPSGKIRSAKSLAKALDAFKREAAGKFAADLLKPNDSDLMTKIKQRLLMSMALAQSGAAADSFAEGIEIYGDDLAEKYGMQDLLTAIAPGLKRAKAL